MRKREPIFTGLQGGTFSWVHIDDEYINTSTLIVLSHNDREVVALIISEYPLMDSDGAFSCEK